MTHYLMNTWYVAAWSSEVVEGEVLSRTLLDEPVALFRRADGAAAAVLDRCPHRFAPLSDGWLDDGRLVCRYHGLGFDGAGACVLNPHGPLLRGLSVTAWPVEEAHHAIWVWFGDPAKADPGLIPDLSYLTAVPATAFSAGMLTGKGNYQLFVDNLMDLSHTDYLHPNTLGGGAVTKTKPAVVDAGDHIEVTWRAENTPPSPLLRKLFPDLPTDTDFVQRVRWYAPGIMKLTAATGAAGGVERDAYVSTNAHITTPETATSSHYFYAATRNFAQEDGELNAIIAKAREEIFVTEDKPMLARVQERMGTAEFWSLHPRMLGIDAAPVAVRRRMDALIRDEAVRGTAAGDVAGREIDGVGANGNMVGAR